MTPATFAVSFVAGLASAACVLGLAVFVRARHEKRRASRTEHGVKLAGRPLAVVTVIFAENGPPGVLVLTPKDDADETPVEADEAARRFFMAQAGRILGAAVESADEEGEATP